MKICTFIITTLLGYHIAINGASYDQEQKERWVRHKVKLIADCLGGIYKNNSSPEICAMFGKRLHHELEISKLEFAHNSCGTNTNAIMDHRWKIVQATLRCLEPGLIVDKPSTEEFKAIYHEAQESLIAALTYQ